MAKSKWQNWALSAALCLAAGGAHAERVRLFAAASLTDVLAELEAPFEAKTGHDLVVVIGGSSALARQIGFGAPADVFISANPDWMDVLEADGLLAPNRRMDLMSNRLVVIGPKDAKPVEELRFDALAPEQRIVMALTEAVPAGQYGKAALEALGLWETAAPHVVEVDNVRLALALVARGDAEQGIVYHTDARAEPDVSVLYTFPEHTHPPIRYPVAAIGNAPSPATEALLAFLASEPTWEVFRAAGFIRPEAPE